MRVARGSLAIQRSLQPRGVRNGMRVAARGFACESAHEAGHIALRMRVARGSLAIQRGLQPHGIVHDVVMVGGSLLFQALIQLVKVAVHLGHRRAEAVACAVAWDGAGIDYLFRHKAVIGFCLLV